MKMKINKKRCGIYLVILLLTVLGINISSAIAINSSEKLELEILEKFDSGSDKVKVIVEVKSRDLINNTISSIPETEFRFIREMEFSTGFVGEVTNEGLSILANNTDITKISFDRVARALMQESLPLINAINVWAEGYTGKNQTICIIDTGINYTSSDLGGCSNNTFLDGNCVKVLGGYDYINIDANPMDDEGHGTHVAGIAAANGIINGTAPEAKIVALKACDSTGTCFTSAMRDSIEWCIANRNTYNISIISMSIGNNESYSTVSDCPTSLKADIDNATYYNLSVFIASGNNGFVSGISWPACHGNATSVGAVYDANVGPRLGWCTQFDPLGNCVQTCNDFTTNADKIWCATNRGSNLDLLAPGSIINSTDISGGYSIKSGTSQAAPHVAGAAALLLERDPTLTPDNITDILKRSGKNMSSWQRIDILSAINSLCTATSWTAGGCGAGSCLDSEREYTRTASPSACAPETKCEYDSSCGPGGGVDITVCQSGCDYSIIQTALGNSDTNDKIRIIDNRSYSENIVMNSTTSPWLECVGAVNITGSSGKGIFLNQVDGPTIVGCRIEGFTYGIHLNSSFGLIQNNTFADNTYSIFLEDNEHSNKILYNNITGSTSYGIWFDAPNWGDSSSNNIIKNNLIKDATVYGVLIDFGLDNFIGGNDISGSTDASGAGISIDSSNSQANSEFEDNTLYGNTEGLEIKNTRGNQVERNVFCPSNTNVDIDPTGSSLFNSRLDNRCDKPGDWDDSGVDGCTFFCDDPPNVMLLDPLNNSVDSDGDINFICYATDNYNLVNITLYHNATGTWHANQTKSISGTSNTTTFSVSDIPDNTIFIWNCQAYDNSSRSSFALANWTINVSLEGPTIPTSLLCNGTLCANNNTFSNNIAVNCSGSIDPDGDVITYSIQALYNSTEPVGGWWDLSWTNKKEINITGGDATFINFTVFLNVSYSSGMQSDFDDIRFLDSEQINELSFEKVSYVDSESAQFFVRISTLSMGTNNIHMYYNNSDAVAGGNPIDTYDFKHVYHFNDTSQLIDIKGNNNCTAIGTGSLINSTFGEALLLDALPYFNCGDTAQLNGSTAMTGLAWINKTDTGGGTRRIYEKDDWNMQVGNSNDLTTSVITSNPRVTSATGLGEITVSQIYLTTQTYDGSNQRLYLDGELKDTDAQTGPINDGTNALAIGANTGGGQLWKGVIDEIWIDDKTRSQAWIARFNENRNQTKISFGAEEYSTGFLWRDIGNHSESSSLNWGISNITEQSGVDLRCRAIDLVGSNKYSDYYNPGVNITISIALPNDTNKFFVRNSSGSNVAWFGDSGNIVLKGNFTSGSECIALDNNFLIKNSTSNVITYIDNSGNMCSKGSKSESQSNCTTPTDFVRVLNSSNSEVIVINSESGGLCLIGSIYENSNP